MRALYRAVFLCALTILVVGMVEAQNRSSGGCELVGENLRQAEKIRGLKARRQVPCESHDKEAVRAHLTATIDTKIPAEKIAGEELIYKAIGLLTDDFDYKSGLINLYVSQLGGYYDPEKKHFVMAAWMPPLLQAPVIVHELTHALQDQHFDLGSFVSPTVENSDMLLARAAVVEGDAMAVMVDASRIPLGQGSIRLDPSVDLIIAQSVIGMRMMPGLEGVPEGLKNLLVFPYTSGLRFAHNRLRQGGYQAIDRVFKAPPRSTEEILHPELYDRAAPSFVRFDDSAAPAVVGGGEATYGDVVGEFLLGTALGAISGDIPGAARVAAGWGGDRATLVKRAGYQRPTLVWRLGWDSTADAAEFCDFMGALLKRGVLPGGRVDCSTDQETVFVREYPAR